MPKNWRYLKTFGILGGTFNPVHLGHVVFAEHVASVMQLNGVLMMPSGQPPHKDMKIASRRHRMNMVRIACRDHDALYPCALEVNRPGVTYTVDTLQRIRHLCPKAKIVYLIGADTLPLVESWKDFDKVARHVDFVVGIRPGAEDLQHLEVLTTALQAKYGCQMTLVDFQALDVASSQVRSMLAQGKPMDGIDGAVQDYIKENRLYQTGIT